MYIRLRIYVGYPCVSNIFQSHWSDAVWEPDYTFTMETAMPQEEVLNQTATPETSDTLSLDGKTKTGQFLAYLKWHSKTGLATLPHCPTSEAGTKGEQCHAECCTELQRATCSKSVVFTSESVWSFALQVSSKWYIVIYTGCMQHAAHLRSLYNFEYLHMLFSRETQIGWTSQVCEQRTLCKRSASHY